MKPFCQVIKVMDIDINLMGCWIRNSLFRFLEWNDERHTSYTRVSAHCAYLYFQVEMPNSSSHWEPNSTAMEMSKPGYKPRVFICPDRHVSPRTSVQTSLPFTTAFDSCALKSQTRRIGTRVLAFPLTYLSYVYATKYWKMYFLFRNFQKCMSFIPGVPDTKPLHVVSHPPKTIENFYFFLKSSKELT